LVAKIRLDRENFVPWLSVEFATVKRWWKAALGKKDISDPAVNWDRFEKPDEPRGLWVRQVMERPKRIWFMSERMKSLYRCNILLVDGTFKAAPNGYAQLVNVMGFWMGSYIPMAHFLVESKTEDVYQWIFQQLFTVVEPGAVERIITDFELAEFNGITKALDEKHVKDRVRISGCLFHYGQALYRFYHRHYSKYHSAEMRQLLNVYLWLPYLKRGDIDFVMKILRKKSLCTELYDHFERWWLPRIDWWIMDYDGDLCITTNCAIESYHGRLNGAIKVFPPSVYDLQVVLYDMMTISLARLSEEGSGLKMPTVRVGRANRGKQKSTANVGGANRGNERSGAKAGGAKLGNEKSARKQRGASRGSETADGKGAEDDDDVQETARTEAAASHVDIQTRCAFFRANREYVTSAVTTFVAGLDDKSTSARPNPSLGTCAIQKGKDDNPFIPPTAEEPDRELNKKEYDIWSIVCLKDNPLFTAEQITTLFDAKDW
jgi:hypothetical protein